MTYFLFGTLWSVLFWVVYFTLGLLATIRILKSIPESTLPVYNYITQNGRKYDKDDIAPYIVVSVLISLFWPVIIVVLFIGKLFSKLIWPSICKAMVTLDKAAPTVTFEKKEEKKDV